MPGSSSKATKRLNSSSSSSKTASHSSSVTKTTPLRGDKATAAKSSKTLPSPDNNLCGYCASIVPELADKYQDNGLQCDQCQLWFHAGCTQLPEQAFYFLCENQLPNIHWFCNPCEVMSRPIMGKLTKIENQLGDLQNRFETLESEVKSQPEKSTADVNSIVREVEDRSRRSKNVIVFGVPESDDINKKLEPLLESTDHQMKSSPSRLGKVQSDKPRPVLLQFETERAKWEVLAQSKKLRSDKTLDDKLVFKPDKTFEQRKNDAKLWTELNQRKNSGEQNLVIRKRKIVQQPSSN